MNIDERNEMEASLIGAILKDASIFDDVSARVGSEKLGWAPYDDAFVAMQSLKEKGLQIDTISLGDELARQGKLKSFTHHNMQFNERAAIGKLRGSDARPKNAMTYVAGVLDYSAKVKMGTIFQDAYNWSVNGRDASSIKSDVYARLDSVRTFDTKSTRNTIGIKDALRKADDRVDRASRGEIVYIKTGLKDLDRLLGGGMEAPDFLIVAGRPGSGKSSLMLTKAMNVAKNGKRVAFFSLEMSSQQIALRMIAQETGISYQKLKQGALTDTEWPVYINALENIEKLPIEINDTSAITMQQTRLALRDMGGADLIVFDYLQLAKSDEKMGTREQEVGYVSRALKQIGSEFGASVLAGAQLSRDIEKRQSKRPVLSDLRESGSLEQDSDVVMFIYQQDEASNARDLIVAKQRNGPTGSIPLVFIPDRMRFEDAVKENYNFERLRRS